MLELTPAVTLPELCQRFPHQIQSLFRKLDLQAAGLERVRAAVAERNWVSACEALLHYYETDDRPNRLRLLGNRHLIYEPLLPDAILADTCTFQQSLDVIPRCADGRLNWAHQGPHQDREWAWFLNRHYQLLALFHAYQQTGDTRYIDCLNATLLDWVISSRSKPEQGWAQWRGREVALRVIHWASLFYGLPTELAPAVRLLLLNSLLDHAAYLRYLHRWGGNWLTREMSGLATIALCWPEFKQAQSWLDYAMGQFCQQLDQQIYPDGVHKELTSHYHRIVLNDLQNVANLLMVAGRPVPSFLEQRIEQMLTYLAYSASPDGKALLNNDSDHDDNREFIQQAAITWERPDWTYIVTHGQEGCPPDRLPSIAFLWAGQVISRSDWEEQAHWSCFDIGPSGINYHIHHDKLHLSLSAYDRHFLVDSGRYSYQRNPFWHYFRGSSSHNVILVDGKGQGEDCWEQAEPLTDQVTLTPDFDFAWGRFDGLFPGLMGTVTHTRSVVYLRHRYWVVVDWITSDLPRTIQALWHFHPTCTVVPDRESVKTIDGEQGNLRVTPVTPFPWQVNLVCGQREPVQGWWSREYNHLEANCTAIYSASIQGSTAFAWIFYPAVGEVPLIQAELLSVTPTSIRLLIWEPDQSTTEFALGLDRETCIRLSQHLTLQGRCAILRAGYPPLVAQGFLTDGTGHRVTTEPVAGPMVSVKTGIM
ncbi:alginate lyase family protein [Leptolyngbya sp. 'hensonii']|uniref:alginate lyase family protein n=1 Tax=Leptolyngbya sp. 'hensonii' TaxID=1922337 RepID=UPI001558CE90|nr:alginate lyase family protein [Leptolyngbya sp. 'hensonii']